MIKRFPGKPLATYRVNLFQLRALVFSLVKQGLSYYGFLYFKYLLNILLTKPRHLPHAINLAVKGHHFFTITKNIMELAHFTELMEHTRVSLETTLAGIIYQRKRSAQWKIQLYGRMIVRKIRLRYRFLNNKVKSLISDRYSTALKNCENIITNYSQRIKEETDYTIRRAS